MNRMFLAVPAMVVGLMMGQVAFAQTPRPGTGSGEATPEQPKLPSTRTRAEATAECIAARKAGKGPTGECSAEPEFKSTRTRAEVQAECAAALKEGKKPSGECSN